MPVGSEMGSGTPLSVLSAGVAAEHSLLTQKTLLLAWRSLCYTSPGAHGEVSGTHVTV